MGGVGACGHLPMMDSGHVDPNPRTWVARWPRPRAVGASRGNAGDDARESPGEDQTDGLRLPPTVRGNCRGKFKREIIPIDSHGKAARWCQ